MRAPLGSVPYRCMARFTFCTSSAATCTPPPPPPPPDPPAPAPDKRAMKEMLELKLVAEIKERADKKRPRPEESPPRAEPAPPRHQDPATRLVCELSESLHLHDAPEPKASLRRAPPPRSQRPATKEDGPRSIQELKARLRKVEAAPAPSPPPPSNGRDRPSPEAAADEEDKRRSTGSITSLKKLWESKEGEDRLSPKLGPEPSPEERARRPALPAKPRPAYATPCAPAPHDPHDPPADDEGAEDELLAALRVTLDCTTNEVRRGCGGGATAGVGGGGGGGGGRGSLWRLQTSERLARLGAACCAAGGSARLPPSLRLQLRRAAQRLESEARALSSPAPHPHHLADAVDAALNDLAAILATSHRQVNLKRALLLSQTE